VLPNGDVLVAESNKPAPPPGQEEKGIKAWVTKQVMKRAGAGVPSPDRILLLRDANGDGQAELKTVFIGQLHSPFGMALVGGTLYVANADAVVRFPYAPGQQQITAPPQKLTDLPAGINHHWTKGLVASPDGRKLYVSVGSNSNAAERGMEVEEGRAAIWEIDIATGAKRIFASGLRNPVGMAFEPQTRTLWAVANERDELGSDLVPDYLTSVRENAFYGWPWSYWGAHVDERVQPPRPDMVARAIAPDYALGNHVAPLGLAFAMAACQPLPAALSSASMGPGTASRSPATRWCSCPLPTGALQGCRRTCSPASSARKARRGGGRSASRSIAAGRCWWPTMWAMPSGGSLRRVSCTAQSAPWP
jgi:glucose/arabinose dehydrogenase